MRSHRLLVVTGVFSLLATWAHQAHAVGVAAGTSIDNTAQVTYAVGAVNVTASSNTTSLRVAEILDVVVTLQTPSVPVLAGTTQQEMLYRVTNTGNGPETFRLQMTSVLGGDDFDPTAASPSIYFDTDGSGDLSPGDQPYTAGSNDPVLNADAFVTVLVVNDIPAGVVDGNRGFSRPDGGRAHRHGRRGHGLRRPGRRWHRRGRRHHGRRRRGHRPVPGRRRRA